MHLFDAPTIETSEFHDDHHLELETEPELMDESKSLHYCMKKSQIVKTNRTIIG